MCKVCVSMVGTHCTKYGINVQPDAHCDAFDSIFLKGDRQLAEP